MLSVEGLIAVEFPLPLHCPLVPLEHFVPSRLPCVDGKRLCSVLGITKAQAMPMRASRPFSLLATRAQEQPHEQSAPHNGNQ